MTRLISSVAPMQVEFTAYGKASASSTSDIVRNKLSTEVANPQNSGAIRQRISGHTTLYMNGSGTTIARNGNVVIFPVDSGSAAFRSIDGGVSITQSATGTASVRTPCYIGSNTFIGGVYVGGNTIHRSTDNGATWSQHNVGFTVPSDLRFLDVCNGYILVLPISGSTTGYISTSGVTGSWSTVTLPFSANVCRALNNRMTIWSSGGDTSQIARATADNMSSWETVTTPAPVRSVAYGRGKYVFTSWDGSTYFSIYESFDFQNWNRILNWSTGSNSFSEIAYDQWSGNFVYSSYGAYYFGVSGFTGRGSPTGEYYITTIPCTNQDNSIMMCTGAGQFDSYVFMIKNPEYPTITY